MQSFPYEWLVSVCAKHSLRVSVCVFCMFANKVVSLALALKINTSYFSFLVFWGVSAAFTKIQTQHYRRTKCLPLSYAKLSLTFPHKISFTPINCLQGPHLLQSYWEYCYDLFTTNLSKLRLLLPLRLLDVWKDSNFLKNLITVKFWFCFHDFLTYSLAVRSLDKICKWILQFTSILDGINITS